MGVTGSLGLFRTIKNDENEPEHVKRRQNCDNLSEREEPVLVMFRSLSEESILAEEAAHGPHASQCQRASDKGPKRNGHFLSQSAHFPDVLFVVQGDDNRAGSEE